MTIPDALRARVLAHLDDEPDPDDRRTLERLLASDSAEALGRAFDEPIAFGTAGLRAEVGPGPSGMNLRNVARATRALLEVVERDVPDARSRGIVVAFDARPTSAGFARAVRALASDSGFRVHAFGRPTATPIAAFAAARLDAAAAVVITASHNPPADNGMKVYGPTASQIVPPWDRAIASRMHDERPTPLIPDERTDRITDVTAAMTAEHRAASLAIGASDRARAPVRIAYTALHGVGDAPVREALAELSGVEFHSVPSQATPDGSFPTTPKPNPEHRDALARVEELAIAIGADAYLANDPDADRLAAAIAHDGEFVVLHGDELGVLFGTMLAERSDAAKPLLLHTIVSSPWLARWCSARGIRCEVTLTGHKWIHDRARALEADGWTFVFGYEEALGYAFANRVRDKDGIAAAVVLARLVGEARAEGTTAIDRLEAVSREVGLHRSAQITIGLGGRAARLALDERLAAFRTAPPASFAGRTVVATIDGTTSTIRDRVGSTLPLGVPPSDLLGFELEDGLRVLLRASGTEPKLKIYLDLRTELTEGERYLEARRRADQGIADVVPELRRLFGG